MVVILRTLLQDRMAALNGRTVKHVLQQDQAAFIRLIGLSTLQVVQPQVLFDCLCSNSSVWGFLLVSKDAWESAAVLRPASPLPEA